MVYCDILSINYICVFNNHTYQHGYFKTANNSYDTEKHLTYHFTKNDTFYWCGLYWVQSSKVLFKSTDCKLNNAVILSELPTEI